MLNSILRLGEAIVVKNKQVILAVICLLLVSLQPALAQTGHLTSDHLRYKKDEDIFIATGNVKLNYDKRVVTAQRLRMDRNKNLAYFSDDVHLTAKQDEIWSQKLKFDLEENILIAQQQVKLNTTKDNKSLNLTSDYLKMWGKSNDLLAQGNVDVVYNKQKIKGDKLEYIAKTEKMIVTQGAKIKEGDNWIESQKVIISLANDTINATGSVEMEFEIKE